MCLSLCLLLGDKLLCGLFCTTCVCLHNWFGVLWTSQWLKFLQRLLWPFLHSTEELGQSETESLLENKDGVIYRSGYTAATSKHFKSWLNRGWKCSHSKYFVIQSSMLRPWRLKCLRCHFFKRIWKWEMKTDFFSSLDIWVLSFPVKVPRDQTFDSPAAKSKQSNTKWPEREIAPFCKLNFFNF